MSADLVGASRVVVGIQVEPARSDDGCSVEIGTPEDPDETVRDVVLPRTA